MALIVKGVQGDLHIIVIEDVFAAAAMSADLSRLPIKTHPDHVEILVVIAHVNVGALGGGRAIGRRVLNEAGHLHQVVA